jgi:hypothetical protein
MVTPEPFLRLLLIGLKVSLHEVPEQGVVEVILEFRQQKTG